jgi:hypothetical protein
MYTPYSLNEMFVRYHKTIDFGPVQIGSQSYKGGKR